MQEIIEQWVIEANTHKIKLPKNTVIFCLYFLKEIDRQGVLFQSIRTISKNSGINLNEVSSIINKLVRLNIMYKNYGVVGIQNFKTH